MVEKQGKELDDLVKKTFHNKFEHFTLVHITWKFLLLSVLLLR